MRPDRVVFLQPLVDDHTSFGHRAKQPAIQTGRSKDRIETFAVGVLPRTAGIDVMSIHVLFLQPFLHRSRNHLRAIVTAQTRRTPMLSKQFVENANDVACRQAAADGDLKTLARKLVNDGQAFLLPSVLGPVKYKIVAPNVVRISGPVYPPRGGG